MEATKYLLKKDEQDKGVLCDKVTIDGFDYYTEDGRIVKSIDFSKYQYQTGNGLFKGIDNMKLEGDVFEVIATNNPNIDLPQVCTLIDIIVVNEFPDDGWGRMIFSEGYNKSQSTHPNSDEDMIEFSDWQTSLIFTDSQLLIDKSTEELLQLWKSQQPKVIYYQ